MKWNEMKNLSEPPRILGFHKTVAVLSVLIASLHSGPACIHTCGVRLRLLCPSRLFYRPQPPRSLVAARTSDYRNTHTLFSHLHYVIMWNRKKYVLNVESIFSIDSLHEDLKRKVLSCTLQFIWKLGVCFLHNQFFYPTSKKGVVF